MNVSHRLPSGFTLLEILVVLVIVGVLASILLAVIVRVSEQGRRTTCESNLHQIVFGLAAVHQQQRRHLSSCELLQGGERGEMVGYIATLWRRRIVSA